MPYPGQVLAIRSRHGSFRDLMPWYTTRQILAAIGALGAAVWLSWTIHWAVPPIFLLLGATTYLSYFEARPVVMRLSQARAAWLEAVMTGERYFSAEEDGRWHLSPAAGGSARDVLAMEEAGTEIDLIGPRPWVEKIRAYLEWVEAGGVPLSSHPAHPFQIGEIDVVPWHAHVPSAVIGAIIVPLFVYEMATGRLAQWGLSGKALAEGRFETILLHMFEHGSIMHIVMNGSALAAIGGALTIRLGPVPLNWARLLLLFIASGLAGAALYLTVHPFGEVPMVGASGALYGLVGLLIRVPPKDEALRTLESTHVRRIGWSLIKTNLFLIALLGVMAWSSGGGGGLAWEAHLGGFLFGFFIGPKVLLRNATTAR